MLLARPLRPVGDEDGLRVLQDEPHFHVNHDENQRVHQGEDAHEHQEEDVPCEHENENQISHDSFVKHFLSKFLI